MEMDHQDAAAGAGIEEIFSALSLNTSVIESSQLRDSISQIFSGISSEEQLGVMSIRKLVSIQENPPLQEVIDTGILPILIKMSYARPVNFTFEVCWILCNIGSGSSQHTKYLVELGSLEFFSDIFESNPNSYELRDQIVWAVGNISGDCVQLRDLVNNSKIFQQILNYSYEILTKNQNKFVANCMWTLSNCVRGKPEANQVVNVVNKCFLEALLIVNDENSLIDINWGLSYTTVSCDDMSSFNSAHLIKMLELIKSNKLKLLVPAIRTIGNIISNSSYSWGILKQIGILETFLNLIPHQKISVKKEIFWSLSNLCSEHSEVVCSMLNLGAYQQFIEIIDNEDDRVIAEMIWTVANSVESADNESIKEIFKIGWAHKFLILFKKVSDFKQKSVIAEGLNRIFNKCPELLDCHLKNEILQMKNLAGDSQSLSKRIDILINTVNNRQLNDPEGMEVV